MLVAAVSFPQVVLAIHILAVVIGFGSVFAFPILFAAAARTDPGVTPWLLRARQRLGRYLVNPGLLVVIIAGIYLASKLHQWGNFYVGWGVLAVHRPRRPGGLVHRPARGTAGDPGRTRPRGHRRARRWPADERDVEPGVHGGRPALRRSSGT